MQKCPPKNVISQILQSNPTTTKNKRLKTIVFLIEDSIQDTPSYFNVTRIDMGVRKFEANIYNWQVSANSVKGRIEKTKMNKDSLKGMVETLSYSLRSMLSPLLAQLSSFTNCIIDPTYDKNKELISQLQINNLFEKITREWIEDLKVRGLPFINHLSESYDSLVVVRNLVVS